MSVLLRMVMYITVMYVLFLLCCRLAPPCEKGWMALGLASIGCCDGWLSWCCFRWTVEIWTGHLPVTRREAALKKCWAQYTDGTLPTFPAFLHKVSSLFAARLDNWVIIVLMTPYAIALTELLYFNLYVLLFLLLLLLFLLLLLLLL